MQVQSATSDTRGNALRGGALLALAGAAVYFNSFSGPFVFDDLPGILDNPTIRHFGTAWAPPPNTTASGRPILNLSLALNYTLSGTRVWSYHAVNLAIHILASLTLFGIARRTLARFPARAEATALAFAIALLWAVHPLQTESVTYVIQRAESLMGLFYLLTLYCFIRGTEVRDSRFWFYAAIFACLLGMATKEVMVSAPVVVLLYDRAFVAGSIREAWRRRRGFYLVLAGTWLVLGALVFSTHSRSGTSGFGTGVTWWRYTLTQFPAIVRYIGLSFWPHPLIFDYGTEWVGDARDVVLQSAAVALGAAAAAFACWRKPAVGWMCVFFFAILAPTSLVPGNRQTMAEHRMYLALAPVIALTVMGAYRLWSRKALLACLSLALLLGALSVRRNQVYRSGWALWADTVAKRPDNSYAHDNVGNQWDKLHRWPEAIAEYETALRLKCDYAETHNNLGVALMQSGRAPEAILHYEAAIRLAPGFAEPQCNLGDALGHSNRWTEAIPHYERALRIKPAYPEAFLNLGVCFAGIGRLNEAIASETQALRLKPDMPEAWFELGVCLAGEDRTAEAIAPYQEAVRLRPNYLEARTNLAVTLAKAGRMPEAIAQYNEMLRLKSQAR